MEGRFRDATGSSEVSIPVSTGRDQSSAKATVDTAGQKREVEFKEVEFKDGSLSFVETLDAQGRELRITFLGKVSGDEISFRRSVGDIGSSEAIAKRESTSPPASLQGPP